MELYEEILLKYLVNQKIEVNFPDLKIDAERIIEMRCYKALEKIKNILADEELSDINCYMEIEKIIKVFDVLGVDTGNRHIIKKELL